MTWGARAGRSALLSLLAVAWAVLAHRLALPTGPHDHPVAPTAATLPALVWAAGTSGLLAWWLAPVGRGDRPRRALAVGAALTGGQVVTHAALALAPLLALRTRTPGATGADHLGAGSLHAGHLAHGGVVEGALTGETALQALSHGGAAMLVAHVVATAAAAVAWAVLGTLARCLERWWVLRLPSGTVLTPTLHRPAASRDRLVPRLLIAFSWDGRGPPAPAV